MFNENSSILIVDDMLAMRMIVKKYCKEMGFTSVIEAVDGNDAWAKLSAHKVDIVISDWNMPNCTGLNLLKRVRQDANFKELPFILLTAEKEASQVKDALAAGVDSYITKPFSKDILIEKLGEVYNKRRAA